MSNALRLYEIIIGKKPPSCLPEISKKLTILEMRVFELYGQGHAIKEIAYRLETSLSAVKNTLERVKAKLGVRSKIGIVLLYLGTLEQG